jgi:hypothetical protein
MLASSEVKAEIDNTRLCVLGSEQGSREFELKCPINTFINPDSAYPHTDG